MGGLRGTVLVRRPGPALARCALTFLERQPIDTGRAMAEHAALEAALTGLGLDVRPLPPLPDAPDAAFVEDIALVLDEAAIVTRPGTPARRAETQGLAEILAEYRPVLRLTRPATLEGGDVLRRGRTLFVGRSGRTNDAGIQQLRALVAPSGYVVVPVDLHDCLHLKTAACAVDEESIVANPAWVDPAALGPARVVKVHPEEPFAANVLRIAERVLTADGSPHTRERLERAGHEVLPVPFAELGKAEAGVTCCTVVVE